MSALQRWQGSYRGKEFSFLAQVEVDASGLVLVGLTPYQSRGFVLEYRAGVVRYARQPYVPEPLPPRHVLSAFLLLFGPPADVASGLVLPASATLAGGNAEGFLLRGRGTAAVRVERRTDGRWTRHGAVEWPATAARSTPAARIEVTTLDGGTLPAAEDG